MIMSKQKKELTRKQATQHTASGKTLTRKQQAFVDGILGQPKKSATQVASEVYNVRGKRHTAEVIASENLRKPEIMVYLANHSSKAENTLVEIMNYGSEYGKEMKDRDGASYAGVAVSAAKDILDRVHGKATQKVEQHSTVVTLSLDLTDITT
jgi:hypothetical protein